MTVKIATNQLKPPVRPKVKDPEVERALRELEAKVVELQSLVRQIAGA